MTNIFQKLHDEIGDQAEEGGISVLHLRDLSPALRKIMRLMLREVQLTYGEIVKEMESLPKEERLSKKELNEALEELTEQFWLIKLGEDRISYRMNLRAKPGSDVGAGLWGSLGTRTSGIMAPPEDLP